jgi:hypothetical protein
MMVSHDLADLERRKVNRLFFNTLTARDGDGVLNGCIQHVSNLNAWPKQVKFKSPEISNHITRQSPISDIDEGCHTAINSTLCKS